MAEDSEVAREVETAEDLGEVMVVVTEEETVEGMGEVTAEEKERGYEAEKEVAMVVG